MSGLNNSLSLQLLGPYSIAPGESAWLGWQYNGNINCVATLQTSDALNVWFTIENTTIMVQDVTDPDLPSDNITYYGMNITNNAPSDVGFVEVSVLLINILSD